MAVTTKAARGEARKPGGACSADTPSWICLYGRKIRQAWRLPYRV